MTRVNRSKIFLYVFIIIVTIKVGLLFPTRQSAKDMIEMAEKFENLKSGLDEFENFDDSLAGNENFRKRILDTVSTAAELRQVRENQQDELVKEIEEFRTLYPDRNKVIMKYKILDGVSNFISVLFVCMVIPLIIYSFKRR